ncbi:MAG: hypothetical protein PVF70_02965 [Anaerolineales bacterium]|jgi:hypothetical protein
MSKRLREPLLWTLVLVAVSFLLYYVYFMVVQDVQETFLAWLGDVAFVPFSLLLVTLIIDRLLRQREKLALRKKMNMVVGAFFSEVGIRLLELISQSDVHLEQNRKHFDASEDWSKRDFRKAMDRVAHAQYQIDPRQADLEELRTFLDEQRNFLLRLIENPSIFEDAPLTDLLWAVFHLMEELSYRDELHQLPEKDYKHLAEDIKRAYALLIREWFGYLGQLKESYPFLYSLALRTDPFDLKASPIFS